MFLIELSDLSPNQAVLCSPRWHNEARWEAGFTSVLVLGAGFQGREVVLDALRGLGSLMAAGPGVCLWLQGACLLTPPELAVKLLETKSRGAQGPVQAKHLLCLL